ncbi:MAG: hypothetical protein ABI867_19345 [Kofleriaceae bacterium]
MEKFPRGTLPPTYVPITRATPAKVERPPSTLVESTAPTESPRGTCDLASTCPNCSTLMQPEHAHYRCATCGYRDSCCF